MIFKLGQSFKTSSFHLTINEAKATITCGMFFYFRYLFVAVPNEVKVDAYIKAYTRYL